MGSSDLADTVKYWNHIMKTPSQVHEFETYLIHKSSYINLHDSYVFKYPNFRYHDNRGRLQGKFEWDR